MRVSLLIVGIWLPSLCLWLGSMSGSFGGSGYVDDPDSLPYHSLGPLGSIMFLIRFHLSMFYLGLGFDFCGSKLYWVYW